jgi:hypothetical protein
MHLAVPPRIGGHLRALYAESSIIPAAPAIPEPQVQPDSEPHIFGRPENTGPK